MFISIAQAAHDTDKWLALEQLNQLGLDHLFRFATSLSSGCAVDLLKCDEYADHRSLEDDVIALEGHLSVKLGSLFDREYEYTEIDPVQMLNEATQLIRHGLVPVDPALAEQILRDHLEAAARTPAHPTATRLHPMKLTAIPVDPITIAWSELISLWGETLSLINPDLTDLAEDSLALLSRDNGRHLGGLVRVLHARFGDKFLNALENAAIARWSDATQPASDLSCAFTVEGGALALALLAMERHDPYGSILALIAAGSQPDPSLVSAAGGYGAFLLWIDAARRRCGDRALLQRAEIVVRSAISLKAA